MRVAIAGFCRRSAITGRDLALMFSNNSRDYAVLDTPVTGNCVFMIVTEEEWEAHRIVMKPTTVEYVS